MIHYACVLFLIMICLKMSTLFESHLHLAAGVVVAGERHRPQRCAERLGRRWGLAPGAQRPVADEGH